MTQLNVSHLRAHLKETLTRVAGGERIEITQEGRVVAVLLHPEHVRAATRTPSLDAAQELQAKLHARQNARGAHAALGNLPPAYAESLLADVRRQRSE